jgi:hypothetical protein
VGLCSHFAEADDPDSDFVAQQLVLFSEAQEAMQQACGESDFSVHFGNSAALIDPRFHGMLNQCSGGERARERRKRKRGGNAVYVGAHSKNLSGTQTTERK